MPAQAPPQRQAPVRAFLRIARKLLGWVLVAGATIYLVRAFDARRGPPLEVWHRVHLDEEFRAGDLHEGFSFSDLMATEERVFAQLEREVLDAVSPSAERYLCRYNVASANHPRRFDRDWNRSFELPPMGEPRGAALLLHGLTDSPYSLRSAAEALQAAGHHVVALRMAGHGTTPGALSKVSWRDWRAAIQVAARHADDLAGGGEFLVVGYSTGGALAVDYAAGALLEGRDPSPDRLLLFSPAIGVTPFARVASWHRALSWLPFFEAFRWTGIEPEYDPFKYNSFPKNGGEQVFRVSRAVQARLAQLRGEGLMDELPPILSFQSLFDDTVLTRAVAEELYAHLSEGESELVLFDLNRMAPLRPFFRNVDDALLDELRDDSERPYRLTLVTNASELSLEVVARSNPPRSTQVEEVELGLSWPPGVYSLSHVAMPFPPDDPLYGVAPADGERDSSRILLGAVEPRGERGLLRVSLSSLMRLRYNPFHAYVDERLRAWTD